MKSVCVLLVTLAFLFSCSKNESNECSSITYNSAFTANVGQKYCIDNDNFIFIEEIENQLCPCTAECIWEGEFIIKMLVNANGQEYTYNIGTSPSTVEMPKFDHFDIMFLTITPELCDSQKQSDFKVGLMVQKN